MSFSVFSSRFRSKRIVLFLALSFALLPLNADSLSAAPVVQDDEPQLPDETPLFRLPFDTEPGPNTWFVVQWYGNTAIAYRRRVDWYAAGQGMHFGLDFGARCGTPVLAIGDGEVVKVDAREHGAGPHNLLILHPNQTVSLYGHLLEAPQFEVGDSVEAGVQIGVTGDPDLTCISRPHLHLEIRSADYGKAFNPVEFIAADWDTLALFGVRGEFERELNEPRRWMTPYDQPIVDFQGALLNEYDNPWPPDW